VKYKRWIAGAALLASLAFVLAVVLVTSPTSAVDSAAVERAIAGGDAFAGDKAIAGVRASTSASVDELGARDSKLAVPEIDSRREKARTSGKAPPAPAPIDLHAPLAPGAVRFSGIVERPDGSPAVDARIGLFARVAGEPEKPALARARTDATGAFCLDAPAPREMILLVCADGLRPSSRPLERSSQRENDLGPLRLSDGAAIEGRVISEGRPLPRAEVAAVLDSPLENFALDDRFVKWSHRRFIWAFEIADTSDDGRFKISGLEPEDYRVRMSALRGRQAVLGAQASAGRAVRAPAEGVDLAIDSATLQVNFRSDGRALSGVQAQVKYEGAHLSAVSDDTGACKFRVIPHLEFTLVAVHEQYMIKKLPLTAPGAGQERIETIDLEPYHPPATIFFDLASPTGESISRARFVFYGSDSIDGRPSFVKEVDLHPPQSTQAPRTQGTHDELPVAAVPQDTYRIVVQAGDLVGYATSPHGNVPYCSYCDSEIPLLAVPATGDLHLRLDLVLRSTIQILARDGSGKMLRAGAKLIDSSGALIESSLAVKRHGIWQSITALDETEPTTVRSTLCSGSADLELSCAGYRTKRVRVSFDGQHSPPIDVTMDRD
jgi:hypothetical protein